VGEKIEEEFEVDDKSDKSSWAIGGTTLIGVGVGLIFLKTSVLFFVASILIGIGSGLVIASFISRVKE
jgi:hypothetical protein